MNTPNKTFWALKKREWDAKSYAPNSLARRRRTVVAGPALMAKEEPVAEVTEVPEPTYREVQAQAKELGIPANQPKADLEKAIAKEFEAKTEADEE